MKLLRIFGGGRERVEGNRKAIVEATGSYRTLADAGYGLDEDSEKSRIVTAPISIIGTAGDRRILFRRSVYYPDKQTPVQRGRFTIEPNGDISYRCRMTSGGMPDLREGLWALDRELGLLLNRDMLKLPEEANVAKAIKERYTINVLLSEMLERRSFSVPESFKLLGLVFDTEFFLPAGSTGDWLLSYRCKITYSPGKPPKINVQGVKKTPRHVAVDVDITNGIVVFDGGDPTEGLGLLKKIETYLSRAGDALGMPRLTKMEEGEEAAPIIWSAGEDGPVDLQEPRDDDDKGPVTIEDIDIGKAPDE